MSILLGLANAFQVVADVIEYGPLDAISINTSISPQAERDYRSIISGTMPSSSELSKSEGNTGNKDDNTHTTFPLLTIVDGVSTDEMTSMDIKDVSSNISECIHEYDIDDDDSIAIAKSLILAVLLKTGATTEDNIKVLLDNGTKKVVAAISKFFNDGDESAFRGDNRIVDIDDKDTYDAIKGILEWEMDYVRSVVSKGQEIKIQEGFKDILSSIEDIKNNIVDPIHTVSPDSVKMKVGFTDKEREKLLKELYSAFTDIMSDHVDSDGKKLYVINILQETAELRVTDKDMSAINRYRIDPGTIVGNGFNLVYYYNDPTTGKVNDYVYVNVKKHADLVKKIIDDPGYALTPGQVTDCSCDMMLNSNIYYFIDMPSFGKHIAGLNAANMLKLERKLTAATNILLNANQITNSARMRLSEWKSLNDFTLVSDGECRSPLAANGMTCPDVVVGLTMHIVKDQIEVSYLDHVGAKCKVRYDIIK